jgi:hypothetical protein
VHDPLTPRKGGGLLLLNSGAAYSPLPLKGNGESSPLRCHEESG